MITSQCPRCSEAFRLPSADLPPDAMAECPWCGETYSVDEIVGRLPPVVQLKSADGQPLLFDHAAGLPIASSMADAVSEGSDVRSPPDESDFVEIDFDESPTETGALEETVDLGDFEQLEPGFDRRVLDGEEAADQPKIEETKIEETWSAESDKTVDDISAFAPMNIESTDFESDQPLSDSTIDEPILEDESLTEEYSLNSEEESLSIADESATAGSAALMQVNARPRQKTKSSPIKGIVGTIGGLLLALPLAGGILLAIGKAPDLGFWPFVGQDVNSTRIATEPGSNSSNNWARPNQPVDASNGLSVDLQKTNETLGGPVAEASNLSANEPMAKPSDYLAEASSALETEAASGQVSYPAESSADAPPERLAEQTPANAPELTVSRMPPPENYDPNFSPDNVASMLESMAMGSSDPLNPDSNSSELAEPELEMPSEPEMPNEPELAEASLGNTGLNVDSAMDAVSETPTSDDSVAIERDAAVEAAVANANQQLAKLMKFDGDESKRGGLVALAYEAVAIVGAEPGTNRNKKVDRLLSNLIRSPLVDDLGNVASRWLDYPRRTTDGAILVGQITSNANGSFLQIAAPGAEQRSVEVSGADLPSNGRILAIGKIDDSSNNQTVEITAFKAL